MKYKVLVIGAGLSSLTAASLMAKRGIRVAVIDKAHHPGGSCGIFKRNGVIFDQGASMLYGFGEKGFNAHRFVFNCLEEPIKLIRHELLYCVNFKGQRIKFWPDIALFSEELAKVFPTEKDNIRRFYTDYYKLYHDVLVENPNYTTPDEVDPKRSLKALMRHPLSYLKFLGYMNKNARDLLKNYFTDPEIFKFFDKLTSTYSYTTLEESPAILAAIMFIDNHVGGSYYPAGSTLFLPGKLEKVIEEHGGDMIPDQEVKKIIFEDKKPIGVLLQDGKSLYGDEILYGGTVWDLYGKLIDAAEVDPERINWAKGQVPTYPSVVLYAQVEATVIPEDTEPIEMLVGNPDRLDEDEVTLYIPSIDDHTLCDKDSHVVIAIGPSFASWQDSVVYAQKKEEEKKRLIAVIEKRFPGFEKSILYAELASPKTLKRYVNKMAVAGPKQMLGQHMFKRLHTRTEWDNLFCCGESTVMGTGTPTVTTSGIAAANAILQKHGLKPYLYEENRKNYVEIIERPFKAENLYENVPQAKREIMLKASRCQYCEKPECLPLSDFDMPGMMRRVSVGNFMGARKIADLFDDQETESLALECEKLCVLSKKNQRPVEIGRIMQFLKKEMR